MIFKDYVKQQIVDFLDSTNENYVFEEMFPMDMFKQIMNELGFEGEPFETNGWQVDFWWIFTKESLNVTLAGSWYYGNYNITKEIE